MRLAHEHAPDEALVLQLHHLLAVPCRQADEIVAVESADDGAVASREQPFGHRRLGQVALFFIARCKRDGVGAQRFQAKRLEGGCVGWRELADVDRHVGWRSTDLRSD
jgi:hypothetical protein